MFDFFKKEITWQERLDRADFRVFSELGMGINMKKLREHVEAELLQRQIETIEECYSRITRIYGFDRDDHKAIRDRLNDYANSLKK